MAIQGISGPPLDGGLSMSFRQINVQTDLIGKQATSERMYDSMVHISNLGNETNLGTSEFQQENEEVLEVSVEKISEIMEKDDEYMEVSNSGTESPFSDSAFQEMNKPAAVSSQMQAAANAYGYFN